MQLLRIRTVTGSTMDLGGEEAYERLDFLGEGTFGVVTRCRVKATGKFVAIKSGHPPNLQQKVVTPVTVTI